MKLFAALPKLWHLWLGGFVVIFLGMGVDVMEVDSAQYASIAREMLHNGEWLEVYEHGETYNSRGFPDKPPLVFWAGALGMWLLGEHNWGFKLIATLVSLLGIWAIGKWANLLFGQAAKAPARIFYAFNAGFLLMNQDLRTDAMLVNFILISSWQLELYLRTRKKSAFVYAFGALALGMLAKGPVALIAILAAFVPDALIRRDWKRLWRPEWLLGIVLVLVVLTPMLYGLYTQWGWEKGIKYYFWTQSFGRITGENVWENNLPATYLLENFAWAFLPWVPLFMQMLISGVRTRFAHLHEAGLAVPAFGFILLLVAMSLSRYKLPHYVYVCWPFAAVWLAGWWTKQSSLAPWRLGNFVIGFSIVLLSSFLAYWSLNWHWLLSILPMLLWVLLIKFSRLNQEDNKYALIPSAWAFVVFGLFANGFFYPAILKYQSSSEAGKLALTKAVKLPLFYHLNTDESTHALHFYSRQVVQRYNHTEHKEVNEFMLYTNPELLGTFGSEKATIEQVATLNYFKVTHLTPAFLNANTREKTVEKRVLVRIKMD